MDLAQLSMFHLIQSPKPYAVRHKHLGLPDFGVCTLLGILKNTLVRKLDLFPSSGEGVPDTYSVGSVRKS
jgi:hypothetical protein